MTENSKPWEIEIKRKGKKTNSCSCPTETDETKTCISILEKVGIYVKRKNTGVARYNDICCHCGKRPKKGDTRLVRYGEPGNPDLQGRVIKTGLAFYWEVKKKVGGVLGDKQGEFIELALVHNCYAGFGDADDLTKYLKKEGLL
tara:strand:+ start:1135 stop:1566 length:432 start_codon:yes stop_codon:yes gene_type:complete